MMSSYKPSHDEFSAFDCGGRNGRREKNCTWWDFELRGKLDRFADLDYATRVRIVQEALQMEDEHRWKRLDEHRDLLARFTRVRWADLYRLGL
jgi:hypothetical protein